jgi:hypothetical protein
MYLAGISCATFGSAREKSSEIDSDTNMGFEYLSMSNSPSYPPAEMIVSRLIKVNDNKIQCCGTR